MPDNVKQLERDYEEAENVGVNALGIDDNNFLYFIDRFQRLISTKRDGLNKNNLKVLAPLEYWIDKFGFGNKNKRSVNWEEAVESVLIKSMDKEFDSDMVRGRGAWKDGGNYIYHDGKDTHGEISGNYMYVRKNKRDIGINDKQASKDLTTKLKTLCNSISFETQSDYVRLLGWCALAPFCGALSWRPSILMTGPTASGKSTVLEKIVVPMTDGLHLNTHQSSVAGVRTDVGQDSRAVLLEEAEGSSYGDGNQGYSRDAKREEFFQMMRSSTSDNAPVGVKSSSDQRSIKYQMKNMFLFVSITPTIKDVADQNRIFKVNFVDPKKIKNRKLDNNSWEELEKGIVSIMSKKNTRAIRSLTWSILGKIVSDSKLVSNLMKYTFGVHSRISDGECILISSYLNVFREEKVDEKNIIKFLKQYYGNSEKQETRDEVDETLELILDHMVTVQIERIKKDLTVSECLICLRDDDFSIFNIENGIDKSSGEIKLNSFGKNAKKEIKRVLHHVGISLLSDNTLAIAAKKQSICRIINKSFGYSGILQRHDLFKISKTVTMDKSTRAVILDIFKSDFFKIEEEKNSDELPFDESNDE